MGRNKIQPAVIFTRDEFNNLNSHRNWTDDPYFESEAESACFIVFEDGTTEGTAPSLWEIANV